ADARAETRGEKRATSARSGSGPEAGAGGEGRVCASNLTTSGITPIKTTSPAWPESQGRGFVLNSPSPARRGGQGVRFSALMAEHLDEAARAARRLRHQDADDDGQRED